MSGRELLHHHRAQVIELAAKHGATNVRVFESVARGEADEASDIDLLVRMEPGRSRFDVGALVLVLVMDLEVRLGCRVDVVTERGLRPRIREHALRDAVPI